MSITDVRPEVYQHEFVSQAMPLGGPGSMTRESDNVMSHRAADRAAVNRRAVMDKVRYLVETTGPLTGSEINEAYARLQRLYPVLLPKVAWDTPRKRAGDLAREGAIEYVAAGVRGHEGIYRKAVS